MRLPYLSITTKIAIAVSLPIILAAATIGLILDRQINLLAKDYLGSQIAEDAQFLKLQITSIWQNADGQDICLPEELFSASDGVGGGIGFRFEPDGCPALGHQSKPVLSRSCFEDACSTRIHVDQTDTNVALLALALGAAECGQPAGLSFSGPSGCLYVWRDESYIQSELMGSRQLAILMLFLAALASLGVSVLFSRAFTQRIDHIRNTISDFGEGDRASRVKDEVTDQIGALSTAVNSTLRRVQQDIAASERVNASLSHQLVAPIRAADYRLTELVDRSEELFSKSSALEATDRIKVKRISEEIEQVSTELGHVAKLGEALQDLLAASRPVSPDELDDQIDLAEMCEILAARFRQKARQRGISIEVYSEAILLTFSNALVEQMLTILLDNAIVYGPGHATIRVIARMQDGSVNLTVCDDGDGPPQKVLEDVFGDSLVVGSTMSSRIGSGGHGIGLLTVRQIAENTGLQFSQSLIEGGGWCVNLLWPEGLAA